MVLQQERSIPRACGRFRGKGWTGSHDSSKEWSSQTETWGQGDPQALGPSVCRRGRGLVFRQALRHKNRSGPRRKNKPLALSVHMRTSKQTW